MSLSQNKVPSDPSLKDLLDGHERSILLKLNCHAVGTIESFDPLLQTATVSINYKQSHTKLDPFTKVYEEVLEDYPALPDVPVIFLSGGSAGLTFPVDGGDECLLLFNDRDISNWLLGSTTAANASPRLHSMADAVALVGLRSTPKSIVPFDADRTCLFSGLLARVAVDDDSVNLEIGPAASPVASLVLTEEGLQAKGVDFGITDGVAKVAATGGLVEISNTVAGTLGSLLQQLLTQLQSLTSTLSSAQIPYASPGGPAITNLGPTALSTISNVGTQVGTIATQISELLK